MERGKRRMKEHPLVPIGMVTTATVLVIGIDCFLTKRSLWSNYMMRARVGAQGATIAAIDGSLLYEQEQDKKKKKAKKAKKKATE